MNTDQKRKQIERLRAQKPPMPWRKIGQRLGISAQAAWRLVNAVKLAPLDKPKRYRCGACNATFESQAKLGPARCRSCGDYGWRKTAEGVKQ